MIRVGYVCNVVFVWRFLWPSNDGKDARGSSNKLSVGFLASKLHGESIFQSAEDQSGRPGGVEIHLEII